MDNSQVILERARRRLAEAIQLNKDAHTNQIAMAIAHNFSENLTRFFLYDIEGETVLGIATSKVEITH